MCIQKFSFPSLWKMNAAFSHFKSGMHEVQRNEEGNTLSTLCWVFWLIQNKAFQVSPPSPPLLNEPSGMVLATESIYGQPLSETFSTLWFYHDGDLSTAVFLQCHSSHLQGMRATALTIVATEEFSESHMQILWAHRVVQRHSPCYVHTLMSN